MSLLILSDTDIRSLLTPRAAIESQRAAYLAIALSQTTAVGVTSSWDDDDSLTFAHTGAIAGLTGVTCKFGMQVSGNAARGLPAVHAIVTVLDPVTGEPLACLNGGTVTALRTAAGIAAATDVLAPADAARLGIVGTGVQAREAARMISSIRDLTAIRVLGRSAEAGRQLAEQLQSELGIDAIASTPAELTADSDIVITATTSRTPVVRGDWLRPGCTILTVGSYETDRREVDFATTKRADLTVADDPVKARASCGILVEARERGLPVDVTGVGDIIAGRAPGRRSANDIVVFHCTGIGVQDASLAWEALNLAAGRQVGEKVDF